jgi:hypothetical protein
MGRVQIGVMAAVTISLSGSMAFATTYYNEIYFNGDSRGYTGEGDWDTGQYKGECASGDAAMGLSTPDSNTGSSLFAHGMVCEHGSIVMVPPSQTNTHYLTGSDDRADTATGTWDSGTNITKAECAYNESVVGISGFFTSNKADKILCAAISSEADANPNSCHTLTFSLTSDNRRSTSGGDWDGDHSKNQCGDFEILKGVSANNSTGELHAILCCAIQPYPH